MSYTSHPALSVEIYLFKGSSEWTPPSLPRALQNSAFGAVFRDFVGSILGRPNRTYGLLAAPAPIAFHQWKPAR